jgi:MSHA biogenesis protein MshI
MSFLTKISQIFAKNNSSQRLGIAFQQQGVSLCSIPHQAFNSPDDNDNDNDITSQVLFHHEKTNAGHYLQAIKTLHDNCDLKGDVTLVLNEAQSQVVQVDKPSVPDNEINSALKWQIKDLVSISPENMVLDYYDAPTLAGGKEKINVVCAPLDELKNLVVATEKGIVKVSAITTQEFAFANLLPPQNEAYLLVCQQPNEEIVLIIVKQKQLFFQRRLRGFSQISSKTAEELSSTVIDDISLEIQRSTDYFERQLKQAPIKGIKVLLPIKLEYVFVEKLAENSTAPVSLLELPLPYHQHRDFGAVIGASLEDVPYSAEADVLAGDRYGN